MRAAEEVIRRPSPPFRTHTPHRRRLWAAEQPVRAQASVQPDSVVPTKRQPNICVLGAGEWRVAALALRAGWRVCTGFLGCLWIVSSTRCFIGRSTPRRHCLPRHCPPAPGTHRAVAVDAGVAGLAVAVQLLERLPGARVAVVAELIEGGTTSHGAGGLWKPYTLGGCGSWVFVC